MKVYRMKRIKISGVTSIVLLWGLSVSLSPLLAMQGKEQMMAEALLARRSRATQELKRLLAIPAIVASEKELVEPLNDNDGVLSGTRDHSMEMLLAQVRHALDDGADVNTPLAPEGTTPLLTVISRNSCNEIVKLLLERKADMYAKRATGCNALQVAIKADNVMAVEMLLLRKCNPDMCGFDKTLPLTFAVCNFSKNADIMKMLLCAGANDQVKGSRCMRDYGGPGYKCAQNCYQGKLFTDTVRIRGEALAELDAAEQVIATVCDSGIFARCLPVDDLANVVFSYLLPERRLPEGYELMETLLIAPRWARIAELVSGS